MKKRIAFINAMLGFFVFFVLIPSMPFFAEMPKRDSGVFLYMGEQILAGKIPYRDVWDHKGPVIYYIDALGLLIGRGSLWGVWLLEFLSLYTAAGLGYVVMNRSFGRLPAIIGSITWLTTLGIVIEQGNWTEEFSLPLSFAALFFFLNSKRETQTLNDFLIGVSLALSFLLRPNNIGIHISILLLSVIYGIFFRHKNYLLNIIRMSAGFTFMLIITMSYFYFKNSFSDAVDAVFTYNYIYSVSNDTSRMRPVYSGIYLLSGMSAIVLISWFAGCFYAFYRRKAYDKHSAMIHLMLLWLPIEFLMSSISGKSSDHYFIILLPVYAILTAFFVYLLLEDACFIGEKHESTRPVWIVFIFLLINIHTIKIVTLQFMSELEDADSSLAVMEYISTNTNEDDYLLMWGAETTLNFVTKRASPTRFVYQYPLYTLEYDTEKNISDFLEDIKEKRPIIIDTSSSNEKVPPIDGAARFKWLTDNYERQYPLKMNEVFEFIASHYERRGEIGENDWPIYSPN